MIRDFSLPAINWKDGTAAGPTARKFLEACQESNIDQLVTFPTHVRGNTLDLLLTNIVANILEVSDQGRLGNSNHTMILVTVQTAQKNSRTVEKVPNWGKANWSELKRKARQRNWTAAVRECQPSRPGAR